MGGFRANIVKMTMGVFTLRCNRHNGTLHFTSILIGATKFLAKENMSKFKFLCCSKDCTADLYSFTCTMVKSNLGSEHANNKGVNVISIALGRP